MHQISFVAYPKPTQELRWLTHKRAQILRRLSLIPRTDPARQREHAALHQAYRHLLVREAALFTALGGPEHCPETLAALQTWPRLDPPPGLPNTER